MHIDQNETTIQRIGDTDILSKVEVYKSMYKSLGVLTKINKEINEAYLRQHTVSRELIYHPIWLAKTLVIADRKPFPSKRLPNVIFADAVSGYRGVFSKIPPIQDKKVVKENLVPLRISDKKDAKRYIKNVQEKQINRSYILKKPIHEIKEISLVYLPLWELSLKSGLINGVYYLNANTGESEKYMSERWNSGKDLL